jgi:predicted dinucleotide-binding enzyme
MNITFIGIGRVGYALAARLTQLGHTVVIAARDANSNSVRQAQAKTPALKSKPVHEAVAAAEVVFLATPFDAIHAALRSAGDMKGRVLVDCTNPVGQGLTHGLNNEISGGEFVQKLVPTAKVVKAFTVYGYENFENCDYPGYGSVRPAMLIAGNDPAAKTVVSALCAQLGWEPVDTGDIAMSLHLEHMTLDQDGQGSGAWRWFRMGHVNQVSKTPYAEKGCGDSATFQMLVSGPRDSTSPERNRWRPPFDPPDRSTATHAGVVQRRAENRSTKANLEEKIS